MAVVYRDMRNPYSDEEFENFTKFFETLPTYKAEDGGSVSIEDTAKLHDGIGFERNAQQIQAYNEYWTTKFNGRIPIEEFKNIMKNLHRHDKVFLACVENVDKNRDGYVTEDEFADVLKMVPIHDPKLAGFKVGFEDFVKEADTNLDGRVSVEECSKWLQSKINCTF